MNTGATICFMIACFFLGRMSRNTEINEEIDKWQALETRVTRLETKLTMSRFIVSDEPIKDNMMDCEHE